MDLVVELKPSGATNPSSIHTAAPELKRMLPDQYF